MRRLLAGAGILLLMSPAMATDRAAPQTMTVTASEYQFIPNALIFRRGVVYRLHLENRGKETHEFTAPEFFKAVRLRNPAALNNDHTELIVHPGEAKDLYFVPQRSGHFPLRCADHDWAGMTGAITIQ